MFFTTRLKLQEVLKEVLQGEIEGHQTTTQPYEEIKTSIKLLKDSHAFDVLNPL